METKTAVEVQSHILLRAEQDIAFRSRLIDDPKGVIKAETGVELPDDAVVFVEEAIATAQKAIPSVDAPLTQDELIQVMGGQNAGCDYDKDGNWGCWL